LEGTKISSRTKNPGVRINKDITAREVRLIDKENLLDPAILGPGVGEGVMSKMEALKIAETLGFDLVEVSPNASPPVVRVMDYGKFIYGQNKTKKKPKAQKLKEIKLRPVTDDGDYQVKLRNLKGFLAQGDKVKVTVRFKGREIAHKELGAKQFARIKQDIVDIGNVDQEAKMEGRQMIMIISPKSKK